LHKFEWKSWRDIKNIAEDIARKFLEDEIINKTSPEIGKVLEKYLNESEI
jgi:hypothetical protein